MINRTDAGVTEIDDRRSPFMSGDRFFRKICRKEPCFFPVAVDFLPRIMYDGRVVFDIKVKEHMDYET